MIIYVMFQSTPVMYRYGEHYKWCFGFAEIHLTIIDFFPSAYDVSHVYFFVYSACAQQNWAQK